MNSFNEIFPQVRIFPLAAMYTGGVIKKVKRTNTTYNYWAKTIETTEH